MPSRRLWQSGRGGRGRGKPPANTRPIRNPYEEPTFRAQLWWVIVREHKRQTGETPWNNDQGNVPRQNNTRVSTMSKSSLWRTSKGPHSSACMGWYNGRTQTKSPQQSCGHENKASQLFLLFDIRFTSSSLPHIYSFLVCIVTRKRDKSLYNETIV